MRYAITVHYDNGLRYADPHLWVWYAGSAQPQDLRPTGSDAFGPVFVTPVRRTSFGFKFKDGPGVDGLWEPEDRNRTYRPIKGDVTGRLKEIWCRAATAFVYPVAPRQPEPLDAAALVPTLRPLPGLYVPDTGGLSGLGATPMVGGGVLFGLYHPNAARVFVFGSFNDWQRPGHDEPDPARFHELRLHHGYFGLPNTWLGVVPEARPGDEYKFCILGGVPRDAKGRFQLYLTDPYARQVGPDYGFNNSVVVDPTTFPWTDGAWRTPDKRELILYELSVYGFTEGDGGISQPGTFAGVVERIQSGYFNDLGVTALALMPLAEFPDPQGPRTLGYSPSLFCTVERDFGSPDDLRKLVDAAHARGLAVILDQVFNHTSNGFNPLWQCVLEHPDEASRPDEGGLYFSGSTPWGNRVATEKEDVQNLLIDACKLLITEYHVDGFRFDATHTDYLDHGFLLRLADALTAFKPSVVLVAENLPNQSDLNRHGYDGLAQWADPFHDKLKALLREGTYQDSNHYTPDRMADVFYFCKRFYAAHTNNVVNYVESHDETSVAFEAATNPVLNQPFTKERKGRLGFFAAAVALGVPMIYMGQEFNVERDRNIVSFEWPPGGPDDSGFYRWARRLLQLRRRYPGLRVTGEDPAADGRFAWMLGPWMDGRHGGGRKILGWRLQPGPEPHETLVILLNFEGSPVTVDLELGRPGWWVKLADVDTANDLPPEGTNSTQDPSALHSADGRFAGFDLPGSGAFLYKWETG